MSKKESSLGSVLSVMTACNEDIFFHNRDSKNQELEKYKLSHKILFSSLFVWMDQIDISNLRVKVQR